ncbi:MAG TPA: guanylate kinase [Pyrinomonadaceae bacterium]|nr:guanylate kinase [Pyrinomonadaceae bacterium]
MKGKLIIISSPSGGGKGTLIKEMLATIPDLGYSVSLTTRTPRFGEENGKHYHFVTREKFEEEVRTGGFLEYAEVHGNMYGTSLRQIEKVTESGKDIILEIDVQGAAAVLEKAPDAVSIFILPPSFETLRARLIARATEGDEDIEVRLRNSINEVRQYERFKYAVVNDELSFAARKLAAVILAERQLTDRQTAAISGILDSFVEAKHQTTGD